MTTIVDFLTAQLDADEAAARAASEGPWVSYIEGRDHMGGDSMISAEVVDVYASVHVGGDSFNERWVADQDHIARHDPARVLREVAAKRAILRGWDVDEGPEVIEEAMGMDPRLVPPHINNAVVVLRALAAIYRDEPGWDERWAV